MIQLFLSSWVLRYVVIALAGLAAFKGYTWYEQRKGEEIIIQRSEAEGTKLSNESAKAINSVESADDKSFDRLFRQYCRDCKG